MKTKFLSLLAFALLGAQLTAQADVIVDTGAPSGEMLQSRFTWRAGQIITESPLVIQDIEQYVRVLDGGTVTFALRADNAGLPGAELFSAGTYLNQADDGWQGAGGLNWQVDAGTYWVTMELRSGQTAYFLRILGCEGEVGSTPPPRPLESEALATIVDYDTWYPAGCRTGWRVFGEAGGVGKTLAEKAAELALSLANVGTPYTWGAKGWDYGSSAYVARSVLDSGYTYCGYDSSLERCTYPIGYGTDCSGLVMWSYNKAFGARRYQTSSNPVWYEGADGQCINNADPVPSSQRQIGDLMCFDLDTSRAGIDHIAMYAGGDSVANASSPSVGIVRSSASGLEARPGFLGYYRPTNPRVDFQARVYSPVDLIVTDPEGFTITAETRIESEYEIRREVFRELYYTEFDVNEDGETDDVVYAPSLKSGSYVIRLIPEADASPNDTYTLEIVAKDLVIELAKDAILAEIPEQGFGIRVDGEDVSQFKPVGVDLKPNDISDSVNLSSRGVVPLAILTDLSFDARTVDPLSVRLGPGGASETHKEGHAEDVDGDGDQDLVLHFATANLGLNCGDAFVTLTGTTLGGTPIEGKAKISPVGCK